MVALICFLLAILISPFKSKTRLEGENAVLRLQLIVLRRMVKGRAKLTNADRWFFVQLYRWFPSILDVVTIIRPETLLHWHRAGFRRYWSWKSRRRAGRPQVQADRANKRCNGDGHVGHRLTSLDGLLLSVYARFAAACTVFFAAFFALPQWLMQSCGLGAVETSAMMIPIAIVLALTT